MASATCPRWSQPVGAGANRVWTRLGRAAAVGAERPEERGRVGGDRLSPRRAGRRRLGCAVDLGARAPASRRTGACTTPAGPPAGSGRRSRSSPGGGPPLAVGVADRAAARGGLRPAGLDCQLGTPVEELDEPTVEGVDPASQSTQLRVSNPPSRAGRSPRRASPSRLHRGTGRGIGHREQLIEDDVDDRHPVHPRRPSRRRRSGGPSAAARRPSSCRGPSPHGPCPGRVSGGRPRAPADRAAPQRGVPDRAA